MDAPVGHALTLWGLDGGRAELVARRENQVYRVTAADGRRWALRLHRVGYRNDRELASELAWMKALAEKGLAVPEPSLSIRGNLHETVDGIQADLLTWLNGVPLAEATLDERAKPGSFRAIGETMSRLHEASDAWPTPPEFERCAWDIDGLLGPEPVWGRFWENDRLAEPEARVIRQARDKARNELTALKDRLDYGLIHADLVRENILLANDAVQLIDFDDGGYGFRLFDIATTLLPFRDEPDFEKLRSELVAGYRSLRPLDTEPLPLFLLLRAFTYVGWIMQRIGEPGAPERCRRFCKRAAELAEAYLADLKGHAA